MAIFFSFIVILFIAWNAFDWSIYYTHIFQKNEFNSLSARTTAAIKRNVEYYISDRELFIVAMTLFGSTKHPGEALPLSSGNNIAGQLAIIDSARNRAEICESGSYLDELLKWGYDKENNDYVAQYSVWEGGGPKIGFNDLEHWVKAHARAREVILASRRQQPDKRITHYHQTGMTDPPRWSEKFLRVKEVSGNTFYGEIGEAGSYCAAKVPKVIPIPVTVKPRKKKEEVARREMVELSKETELIRAQYRAMIQ